MRHAEGEDGELRLLERLRVDQDAGAPGLDHVGAQRAQPLGKLGVADIDDSASATMRLSSGVSS